MKSFFFVAFLFFTNVTFGQTSYEAQLKNWSQSSGTWAQKMNRLYELHWKHLMVTYPEWATYAGYPGQNDRLSDRSMAAVERSKKESRWLLSYLNKVPEKSLKGEDLITFKLFKREVEQDVRFAEFPQEFLAIQQMGGIQQNLTDLLMAAPRTSFKDYQDRIARLKLAPKKIKEIQVLLAEGLRRKITPPRVVLASVPSQFDAVTSTDLAKNPLYQSFMELSTEFTEKQKSEIQSQAKEVLLKEVIPAFSNLKTFLVKEYLPGCREEVAWTSLPNGKKWYEAMIEYHTTTQMTAEEVHQLGLKEVARIRAEMDEIRKKSGFKKDLKAFDKYLKEDKKFFYKSAKEMMTDYRDIAKRIDPELPQVFGKLPRLPYGVREMSEFKATSAPTAYYHPGSPETGRAGYFEVNTYDLKARPKWQMEALTLHEAMPGHHLQIALSQELHGFPKFRQNYGPTVYVEGWGLYAESLGENLGLYKDVYSKYGQLTYEMWRAIRLVVDTGIHSFGWSRDKAMQYFRDHGPFSEQQIMNETDRYIANPGQALAYKIGELKFKSLKQKAQSQLGDSFDIRKFHDAVLGSGALPLDILDNKVAQWIQSESSVRHPKN